MKGQKSMRYKKYKVILISRGKVFILSFPVFRVKGWHIFVYVSRVRIVPHEQREITLIINILKINVMKANAKNQERVNAVNNLRNANKESKSISGCIKIIAKLWGSGYNEAFGYFGITYKQLNISLLDIFQKDEEGNVYIVSRKALKNEQGDNVLNEKGKKIYDTYNKVVTTWTPATLWKVLEQSMNK